MREPARRREALAQRDRRVVGRRIDDGDANVAHVAAQREAEQHDLHERHEQQDRQRLPVAQDVAQLLHA